MAESTKNVFGEKYRHKMFFLKPRFFSFFKQELIPLMVTQKIRKKCFFLFLPFCVKTYGVAQNPFLLPFFFTSACTFGQENNRPKRIYRPDNKCTQVFLKHFQTSWTHIDGFIRGNMGFPFTNPNPDFAQFDAKRIYKNLNN